MTIDFMGFDERRKELQNNTVSRKIGDEVWRYETAEDRLFKELNKTMNEEQINELSKQGEARLEDISGVNESPTGYDGPEEPESEGEVLAEEEATEQE